MNALKIYLAVKQVPHSDDYYDDHVIVSAHTTAAGAERAIKAQPDYRHDLPPVYHDGRPMYAYGKGRRGRRFVGVYRAVVKTVDEFVVSEAAYSDMVYCRYCDMQVSPYTAVCSECNKGDFIDPDDEED